jgi:diguanylate cyclase (GGDEF)-like protein/PAS domain S-box-containing protein
MRSARMPPSLAIGSERQNDDMARLPLALSERAARLSIRSRLLLLVLALGLPFLAYIAIEAASEVRADRELAKERSLAVARVVAARLDDYVGDINQLLATLSHVAAIGPEHASENDALLREMERDLPSYINNVALWSLSGANVGSLNPQTRIKGASVADRRYFKDAISTRKLSLEAPTIARTNGELVAIFSRPVMHGDNVVGVVSASTQLKHLQNFLDREGSLPKDSIITVIDPQGIVLARSAETDKWLGKNVSDQEAIRTTLLQGEGVTESAGVDAVARLYGYTRARSVPWLVYVGITSEAALTPVWLHLYRDLKLGGTLLLIAVIVAVWIGEKIASPMHQLASDAAALGAGDLGHRSSVATGGEAALLAQTLNSMAQSLQQRSHALEHSEQRLHLIADHMPALIAYVDRDERFRFTNAFYGDVYGVEASQIIGKPMRELMGEKLYAEIKPKIDEALQGLPITYDLRQTINGVTRDLTMTYFPDYGEREEVAGFYLMGLDVTARTAAESSLRKSELRLRAITDNLPVLISVIDRDEIYRFCNATYRDWLGVDPASIVGCRLKDVSGLAEYAVIKPFVKRALAGEAVTFEHTGMMGSAARHMLVTYLPLRGDKNADKNAEDSTEKMAEKATTTDGFYVLVEDLTQRKTLEDQLSHMAQYDQLTGLPNRYLLHDRLQLACQRSARESKQLAVLYLDVDDFKSINDALGHAAGDALLKQFGQRLKGQVRASDTVARVGGDEFVVLMEGFFSLDHLRSVASKIVEAMQPPFDLFDRSVHVSASIGVATSLPSGTWEEVLHAADSAMYEAKAAGSGRFVINAPDLDAGPSAANH